MTRIIISMRGGCLEAVTCDDPNVQIVSLDWDDYEDDPGCPLPEIGGSDGWSENDEKFWTECSSSK